MIALTVTMCNYNGYKILKYAHTTLKHHEHAIYITP